jgi:soluble lytic murein transglycosylase
LAADALAQAAQLELRADRPAKATALLAILAKQHPNHPKRLQLEWEQAWAAFRGGKFKAAADGFARVHGRAGRRRHLRRSFWSERANYWRARSLWALDKKEPAIQVWRDIVARHPLSYYAHQSFNRLLILAPNEAAKLRKRAWGEHQPGLTLVDFKRLSLPQEAELEVAAELVRIGLFDAAKDELEARARGRRLSPGARTLLAGLHLRENRASGLPSIGTWRGTLPGQFNDAGVRLWKLAYPLPYWDHIEGIAKRLSVSPWLVISVIRHESSYAPKAVSSAGARGLMQLMPKTAGSVATRLLDRRAPSRRRLKDPGLNILLGTRLLKELSSLFRNNQALVLAAYNAGSGAARGWLRGHWGQSQEATDVFVEEIPFSQTQAYVKAVLGSFGVYRFLYAAGDDARSIPANVELPTTLGPYFK